MSHPVPESPESQRRIRRARLWAIVGTLAVLLLMASAYLYLRDVSPPDDSDLLLTIPYVPDADDGLVQLRKLDANRFSFETFAVAHGLNETEAVAIRDGRVLNDALVDEFLAQVEPDFAAVDQTLAMPYFRINVQPTPETLAPEISVIMAASRASALGAARYQRTGNYAAATTHVLRLRHFAVRLAEAPGFLVDLLVAARANDFAAGGCASLLNDPALPPAELARLQAGWGLARWNETMRADVGLEYSYITAAIQTVKTSPGKMQYYGISAGPVQTFWMQMTLHEGATRRDASAYSRIVRAALGKNYAQVDWPAVRTPAFLAGVSTGTMNYLSPNFGGWMLLSEWVPAWTTLVQRMFLQTAKDRLLQTGLAARHFYDDHHALPAKLDDLVPQYLPKVPLDPYDGKPLRYDATQGLIYSVGESLKDTGGSKATSPSNAHQPPQLFDASQPTLPLTFQNPPAPVASAATTSGNPPSP